MGTNQWKHLPGLNKSNTDTLSFYLSNQKSSNNHYKLQNNKLSTSSSIIQEIDFTDRSDSTQLYDIYSDVYEYLKLDSTMDTRKYISFITEPLKQSTELTGSFTGELLISINKKDVDLKGNLFELQPDGKYFHLSNFITRASFAKDRTKRQLLTPYKVEKIPINNSLFVSKTLSKGSRLILLIGVNKNQHHQINYGSGKDVNDETIEDGKIPLEIKWFNNSTIKIPVRKSRSRIGKVLARSSPE